MARSAVRLLSVFLAFVTAMSLVACGADEGSDTTKSEPYVSSINLRSGAGFGDKHPRRPSEEGAAIGGGLKGLNADAGCTGSHPNYIAVEQGGVLVPTLYECADDAGASTEVHNTSDELVWSLARPGNFLYWSVEQSWGQPLAVQLFRAWLRENATGQTEPQITLEPGSVTTIPAHWASIRMRQSPGVQLAWNAVTTGVETVQNSAEEYVEDIITNGSLTRSAILTCAQNGYELGKTLAANTEQPPQEPSEQLALVFGLSNNVTECVRAIQRAADSERAKGQKVALSFDELRLTTETPTWRSKINFSVNKALQRLMALAPRG